MRVQTTAGLSSEVGLDITVASWKLYFVDYVLDSPDGRIIEYQTFSALEITKDNLINAADDSKSLDTPTTAASLSLGISTNTLRFKVTVNDITLFTLEE